MHTTPHRFQLNEAYGNCSPNYCQNDAYDKSTSDQRSASPLSILDQILLIKQILQEFREHLKIPQTVLDQSDANPCPSHVQYTLQFPIN